MIIPNTVIHINNIAVRYRAPEEPIRSLKSFIIQFLQRQVKMKDFWALNDISLDIHSGETFALIGRNGAGKTTLLKVVSRVLSPTHGRIVINGQVAPLLEFGAGFQPELTGRENIYLNGTLLGHRRRDIDEHFEEILSFAQLDGFIDAPLRRYSSGMVARLGFAIATSWKPEILILDEVLAVGDEGFRAKCFTRINKFRDEGSTILLVTHAMSTVLERCNRAAWLDHGNLKSIGQAGDVVKDYLDFIKKSEEG